MSSILRALKKLEKEPRHLEESQSLNSTFVPLADTGPQRHVPKTLFMVAGIGIISGLVILAGWWFLSGSEQSPPAVTQITTEQVSDHETISPPQTEAPGNVSFPEKTETIGTASVPKQTDQQKAADQPDPEPVIPKETTLLTVDRESTVVAEKAQMQGTGATQETVRSISEKQLQPAEKPVVPSAGTFSPQVKAVAEEIPKLKDPDMKLQAVTWSKTPKKRVAVINNRILREGDSVSGYLLSTINQDDVVLVQDGIKWKLLFR